VGSREAAYGTIAAEEIGMTTREILLTEIEQTPEPLLDEVLGFVRLLKKAPLEESLDLALASESALAKDWLRPEEDEAWRDL
jgi:hypothetical protein